jgi:hypothetical protein
MRADSLESSMEDKQEYWDNIRNILAGGEQARRDTVTLEIPDPEKIEE